MPAEPAPRAAPAARSLAWLLVPTLLLGAGALAMALHERPRVALYEGSAFQLLFARDEPAGAALLLALVLGAVAMARLLERRVEALIAAIARRRRAIAAVALVALALGAWWVYGARPLAMDEYAPWFQARIFAAGRITTRLPPDLIPWVLPARLLYPFFAMDVQSGAVASAYWPGFALLLTPFALVRAEWLLDPLLGAACLLLVARLAWRFCGSAAAAGWAVLLTVASTAFTVNAMSLYPLTAHLLCNLIWMELMTEGREEETTGSDRAGTSPTPTPERGVQLTGSAWRLLAAGGVGSLALVLHNPVPHAIFALPWVVALLRRRGVRALVLLAVGYAPLVLLLGAGWWLGVRQALGIHAPVATETGADRGLVGALVTLIAHAFTPPQAWVLRARLIGLLEVVTWAAPFLPVLAALGWRAARRRSPLRLLAASAVGTLLLYCFVPFDQGHGWGYRYFHATWMALPLLAAAALVEPRARRWRAVALAGALLALPLATALRAWQVGSFVREHRAQLPPIPDHGRQLCLLDVAHGSYRVDLLQNDPLLRNRVLVMASYGPPYDGEMLARHFPGARLVGRYPTGTVWSLPESGL